MEIESLKIVCVGGWGRSGLALCDLLLSLNKRIRVSECRERSFFSSSLVDEYRRRGVSFEFGGHNPDFIKDAQLLVLSPGIDPVRSPLTRAAGSFNIPCVGEVEFAFWLNKARLIAITGTNGKTTTAQLAYQVLRGKYKRVFLGGNIGTPFSSFVLNTRKGDLAVLEISSFQLETILKFKPYIAALLNIEPDHLDRYRDFDEYFRAKTRIFKNQDNSDVAVINKNLYVYPQIAGVTRPRISYFSREFPNENFSCVYRIARVLGLSKDSCRMAFGSFAGIAHRLQLVRAVNGVKIINDSKATNTAATSWALKNIRSPVILIAGGKDKGLDYSKINSYRRKVKKIKLFGEASQAIREALASTFDAEIFTSLEGAVRSSFSEAKPGDTILFSPMCSSFDHFSSYAERGDKFMEIARSL